MASKLKEKDEKITDLESILFKEDELESGKGSTSFQRDKQYLDEISIHENIIKNLLSKLDELQEKLSFFEKQASDLGKQTTIMKQTIIDYEIYMEKLKDENTQYKQQYDTLQEKYFEKEKILDEMKSMEDNANDSVSFQASVDLGQEVIDLLLKERDDKLLELQSENNHMADRLNELTVQLNEKNVYISELQLNISSYSEEINLKNEQLSCYKLKEEMLNKLSSECEELRKQANLAERLKMELENMKENFMNEKQVSENLRKEVLELKNLQASNKIIISEIGEKNSLLVQNIELSNSELSDLILKNEKLEKILSDKSKEIICLNSSIMSKDKLIDELNGVRNEYKTFQDEHKNCVEVWATMKSLKEGCIRVEEDLKLNFCLIIRMKCENEELKIDRTKLKLALEEAKENLNDLEKKHINQERELHFELENQLVVVKEKMQFSLEDKDKLLQKLSSECEELKNQVQLLENLKLKLQDTQEKYEQEKLTVEELKKELFKLEDINSSNQVLISEFTVKNNSLLENLQTLSAEFSISTSKVKDLEETISIYNAENNCLHAQLASKEKLVDELHELKIKVLNEYNAFKLEHEICNKIETAAESFDEKCSKLEEEKNMLSIKYDKLKDFQNRLQTAYEEATKKWEESVNNHAITERVMQSDFENELSNMRLKMMLRLEEKEVLLKQASNDNEALRKQLQHLETLLMESENIQKNYEHEKQATENLKKELNELESLYSCNQLTVSELNEKNSILMEYNDLQCAHSNCNEIKEAADSLRNDFCRLEETRNVLRNENEMLKNDKTKLQLSYEKASNELKNLASKMVEREKELKTYFEKQLADIKENSQEQFTTTEFENLKLQVCDLKKLQTSNQRVISELNEKNSSLIKDSEQLKLRKLCVIMILN
ncbi:uncharacterized protein LOC142317605 [Lycorma delicatula]|uniref:uncharacterized protein LOC142317605 n=1 Tax=Lycorma delicatula TaxID=130591 RepID=UPI003F50DD84